MRAKPPISVMLVAAAAKAAVAGIAAITDAVGAIVGGTVAPSPLQSPG